MFEFEKGYLFPNILRKKDSVNALKYINQRGDILKNTSLIILTGFLTFSLVRAEITTDTNNKPNWIIKSDIINQNALFAQSDLKSGEDDHPFPYQILYRINLKSHTDFGVGVAVVFDSLLWVSAGVEHSLSSQTGYSFII